MENLLHTIYFTKGTYHTKQECLDNIKKIQRYMTTTQADTEQIIALTAAGHCIRFGKKNEDWESQSAFGIDIDNLHSITVRRLLTRLHSLLLKPFAVFSTLSDSDPLNPARIRLYFALDRPVTNLTDMRNLIQYVCDMIEHLSVGSVDYSCTTPGHIFFPGTLIYQEPQQVIHVQDHLPMAQILASEHPILLDKNAFFNSFKERSLKGYGVSGTIFSDIPLEPDYVLLGITKNEIGKPALQFLVPRAPSMIYLNLGVLPSNVEYHRDRNTEVTPLRSIGDKRYKNNISIKRSNAQKSTEDRFYYAKVQNYTFPLFRAYLCNHLAEISGDVRLTYDNLKNNSVNNWTLNQLFPVEAIPTTLSAIQHNVIEYRQYFMKGIPDTYPFLKKFFRTASRRHTFTAVLSVALYDLACLYHPEVSCDLQYIINAKRVLSVLGKSNCQSDSMLTDHIHLFYTLGLIHKVDPAHINKRIRGNRYHKYPTVVTIPYFDEILLAQAEQRAKQFIETKQTIRGNRITDTKCNDTYLKVKQCVIFLLDKEQYLTRTKLIQLIEAEGISGTGHKGDWIADRYLSVVAKELRLHKQRYRSSMAALLPKTNTLNPGSSIIYTREDLYQHAIAKRNS